MTNKSKPYDFMLVKHSEKHSDTYGSGVTYILGDHLKIRGNICLIEDREEVFNMYKLPQDVREDIERALAGKNKPTNLAQLDLNDVDRRGLTYFAEQYIRFARPCYKQGIKNIIKQLNCASAAMLYCKHIENSSDIRDILKNSESLNYIYLYCCNVANDADMRQAIIDAKGVECQATIAMLYCQAFNADDPDMRQVIIDDGDPHCAYWYCEEFGHDPDMRQVILDAKDEKFAALYCQTFKHYDNSDLRQVIINKGKPEVMLTYLKNVDNDDDEMRQALIDSKDPKWAYMYCKHFGDDADMRQVILDAADADWASMYCGHIKNDAEMRQVILDGDQGFAAIQYYCFTKKNKQVRDTILRLAKKDAYLALDFCIENYKVRGEIDSEIRQIIIDSGDAELAFTYLTDVVDSIYLQEGVEKGITEQQLHDQNSDMRQVIVDAGDGRWAYEFCVHYGYRADMMKVIISDDNHHWAKEYLDELKTNARLRAKVPDEVFLELTKRVEGG